MVQQPESVSGDLGESVTLSCLVDSNPAPKYTWTKGDSRQVKDPLLSYLEILEC